MTCLYFIILPKNHLFGDIKLLKLLKPSVNRFFESAQELDPPDKFKSTHDFFLSGLSKYAEAMPIFRSGIDNLDADKIQLAANLIAEGAQLINQATQEVNKVR